MKSMSGIASGEKSLGNLLMNIRTSTPSSCALWICVNLEHGLLLAPQGECAAIATQNYVCTHAHVLVLSQSLTESLEEDLAVPIFSVAGDASPACHKSGKRRTIPDSYASLAQGTC
eukprot:875991-Pelagomonas_calceolata.AAC.3